MVALYKINDVADYLYAQGHIKSMTIVMPNFYNDFGGTFYPDVTTLEEYITAAEEQLGINPSARAISGLGMGGYGAVKAGLEYPDMFNTVSSHNGFLHFKDFRALIPNVLAENPRGILFSGKLTSPEGVALNGNREADTLFASGDETLDLEFSFPIEAWEVAPSVNDPEAWHEPGYTATEFSSNDLADQNDPQILGISNYSLSPANSGWEASLWDFTLDEDYRNPRYESNWVWADTDEVVPSTTYFRRPFIIHPERKEGDQDTFHVNWSFFPTGHFDSPVEADSFWVYINGKLVQQGKGFNTLMNPDTEEINKIEGMTPFTIDDLEQDSLGVIAMKVETTMGPAAWTTTSKEQTNLFFAMGNAFSMNTTNPQFPYAPGNIGIDLPFNGNGEIDEMVWREWEYHDVYTRLDEADVSNLNFFIDASTNSIFNTDLQTEWFRTKLVDYNANFIYETYSGGQTDQFYNRIEPMLTFHSDNF
jgi:hypothetical protein